MRVRFDCTAATVPSASTYRCSKYLCPGSGNDNLDATWMRKQYASGAMQTRHHGPSARQASGKSRKAESPKVKDFQLLLRTAGLRSTAPRIAVLEYFHVH